MTVIPESHDAIEPPPHAIKDKTERLARASFYQFLTANDITDCGNPQDLCDSLFSGGALFFVQEGIHERIIKVLCTWRNSVGKTPLIKISADAIIDKIRSQTGRKLDVTEADEANRRGKIDKLTRLGIYPFKGITVSEECYSCDSSIFTPECVPFLKAGDVVEFFHREDSEKCSMMEGDYKFFADYIPTWVEVRGYGGCVVSGHDSGYWSFRKKREMAKVKNKFLIEGFCSRSSSKLGTTVQILFRNLETGAFKVVYPQQDQFLRIVGDFSQFDEIYDWYSLRKDVVDIPKDFSDEKKLSQYAALVVEYRNLMRSVAERFAECCHNECSVSLHPHYNDDIGIRFINWNACDIRERFLDGISFCSNTDACNFDIKNLRETIQDIKFVLKCHDYLVCMIKVNYSWENIRALYKKLDTFFDRCAKFTHPSGNIKREIEGDEEFFDEPAEEEVTRDNLFG